MLYRKIELTIEEHLKSGSKKILVVDGARQVGKTTTIRQVGKKIFKNYEASALSVGRNHLNS